MQIILVILFTLISFLAIILLLASKPKYSSKITRTFIVISGLGGMFFYGYGFAATIGNFWLAAIRALLAVCGMYVGKTDLGSISAAPLMQYTHMQLLFWVVHFLALYATASAAITTVGAEALRKLRLWLVRRGALHLIYGVSDDTMELGRQVLKQKQGSVVFVDRNTNSDNASSVLPLRFRFLAFPVLPSLVSHAFFPGFRTRLSDGFLSSFPASLPQLFHR